MLLEKKRLLHARPERKVKYNQSLRVDEIRTIAKVLEDEKEVYIDTDHQNIVYAFDDRKDETKINKLVIDLNHIVKKFGTKNVVLTFSKVNRSEFDKANYIKTK